MKKKKERKSAFKRIKFILAIIFIIIICVGCYIIKSGYDIYKEAISDTPIQEKINSIKSDPNYTTINNIPSTFQKAIISVEDKRFYTHTGIDIISIGRAVITDISTLSLAEGGSTITQQLAKNLYFSQEKKFSRKIAEVFLANKLEELYEKNDILELYLNVIYFGDGYYGIYEASKGYFNKLPSELTKYEQTLLAGLPNAPSVYQLSNNSDLTNQRQNIVLETMAECGYLTTEQITEIKNGNLK